MYYVGDETTTVRPITTARKTEARKAYSRKFKHMHLCRTSRPPMNRKGAPTLGIALPWNFSDIPGRGSLTRVDTANRSGYSPSTWKSFSPFGAPRSMGRKPGTGRSRGGLGDAGDAGDTSLGLSFNVPALVSNFRPTQTGVSPVTPASGASSFWNPLASMVNLWNNRPQVLKDIRLRVNPSQVVRQAQNILPPGQLNQVVENARRMGIDPSFLTKYGEVPITGNMAEYGYRSQGIDWATYLPWIAGGAAAFVLLPMILKK